ncbi:MAG: hypothetical protein WCE71_17800, partial [Pseudonocardiaceae bacterium]
HTFEVMAPARRAWTQAPPGSGERLRFQQTDGTGDWTVHFDGDDVRLNENTGPSGRRVGRYGIGPDVVPLAPDPHRPTRRGQGGIGMCSTATSPSSRPYDR